MTVHAVEAVAVAMGTLSLVIARPGGLNEGIASLIGGAVVLLLGLVTPAGALRLEGGTWNIFLFFLGMMGIAGLADQSGVFDLVAAAMARLARGRVVSLYVAVFALGASISILFANDSAALVLTPIVYALVLRLSLDPLPFVFATTFIADTASIALPVSNPLNVIVSDGFHLGLGAYVAHLWLSALLVIVVNLLVFLIVFRRGLRGRFERLPDPVQRPGLASTFALLAAVAAAYLIASALQAPLGLVALAGAAALGLNLLRLRALDSHRLAREISWPIFGFIAGMLLVVQGLDNSGVTAVLGRALTSAAAGSHLSAIAVATVGTAVGSNLINNLPMSLVMVHTIQPLHVAPAIRQNLVYGTILGCDLGPNLTHLGSLATFIWLFFLRRKGLEVSTWDYFRIGILTTPLMLVVAIAGLWLTS